MTQIKNKSVAYFFQGGRTERLDSSVDYAKEMFYGFHYFQNNYENVIIKEFESHKSRIRRLFFLIIEKRLRSFLKLPLYWSFLVNRENYKIIKKSDYCVFSSNRIGCSALPMLLVAKLFKSKNTSLSFILGLFSRKPRFFLFEVLQSGYIHLFLRYIDKFIFLSEGEFNYAVAKYPKLINKFNLLPFAVDLDLWKFNESSKEKNNILFVGNDGFRDFDLAENLSHSFIDLNFVYVSEFIKPESINTNNSKILKGSWGNPGVSDIELRDEYYKAKLTIIPLKESLQPSGQSVALQSLACGTPVLITKTEGFWDKKNFKNKKNIFFAENNKIESWTKLIQSIINESEEELNQVVMESRNLIEDKYSLIKFSKEIENILLK